MLAIEGIAACFTKPGLIECRSETVSLRKRQSVMTGFEGLTLLRRFPTAPQNKGYIGSTLMGHACNICDCHRGLRSRFFSFLTISDRYQTDI